MLVSASKIKGLVEANFKVVKARCSADELVFVCPQPRCGDSTGNRSVNLRTGATNCFRCNVGGFFFRWARKLGLEISEDDVTLASTQELGEILSARPGQVVVPVLAKIRLPKGSLRLADNLDSAYAQAIARMAQVKNLTLDDMVEADVHFTRSDDRWEGQAIFPAYEWRQLVFYQGRRLVQENEGVMPKLNPSREEAPLGAKHWVYNIDAARQPGTKVVVIVESILNVLSLRRRLRELKIDGVVPVAVFKHAISRPQQAKLLSCHNLKEICIMYDADATAEAWRQGAQLGHVNCTVAEMPWTTERPTLDPNDDVEAAIVAFRHRRRVGLAAMLEIQARNL
jgi:hypothetical protein